MKTCENCEELKGAMVLIADEAAKAAKRQTDRLEATIGQLQDSNARLQSMLDDAMGMPKPKGAQWEDAKPIAAHIRAIPGLKRPVRLEVESGKILDRDSKMIAGVPNLGLAGLVVKLVNQGT